jgi:CDP-glucose 4,6-dehydratase
MTVIKGSVTSYKLLEDILTRKKINVVFHLAAEAIVGQCLKNPRRTFSANILGTWNILETCRNVSSIQEVIVASSDKAYGSHKKLPYHENYALAGLHPYDVSKSCADLLAHTYFHTYGLPVCVTRCGNIYGPGDFHFSRIVPDVIRSAFKNNSLLIRSDGTFTRDYVYVDDIVDAYLCLAQKMRQLKVSGQAFNFSNETPVSVLELVKTIYILSGKKPDYQILNRAECEIRHQYLSSVKAKKILDWKPCHTLGEGLKKTIAWYQRYLQHVKK